MNFKTVEDLVSFVDNNTEYKAIKKKDLQELNIKYKIPKIYTKEGEEILIKKGYFPRRYIWQKVGYIFNHFKCNNCKIEKSNCKKCRALRVIINSL